MGHQFSENLGYNTYRCLNCGLDSYAAEGLWCRRRASVACPTQSNGHTHLTCREQFDDTYAANDHWWDAHYKGVRVVIQ